MTEFFAWFEKSRKRSGNRSWRGRHRSLLAMEILEPRQMLAADGLGGFVPWEPLDHACLQVCDGVVLAPEWSGGQGDCGGKADSDGPMQVHLEDIAEEVGEVFEIEDQGPWWLDAK